VDKPVSEKVQNENIRFVPVVRRVSANAEEDLKELEEMMKQLENMRKKVIKWSRV
jgi:archaellum biogenesis ATPase FlaH